MPTRDFFDSNPTLADVEQRVKVTRASLFDAKAGPNAHSYVEQHRIATLSDDLNVLENRLESMRSNAKQTAQA